MKLTREKAIAFDNLLTNCISLKKDDDTVDFDGDFVAGTLDVNDRESDSIIEFLCNCTHFGDPLVFTVDNYQFFTTTHVTKDFLNSGGFVTVYEDALKKQQDQEEREKLEIEALKLGPKQHRFNKFSVIINLVLTLITIILSILIATNVIE